MRKTLILALGLGLMLASGSAIAGDATKGEKVFKKCKACHTLEAGKHRTGPSLHGVVGRKAGSTEFKRYKGLKEVDFVWDEANLDAYLADPKKFVLENTSHKRTGMTFKLKKADERADVIAYLKTIK